MNPRTPPDATRTSNALIDAAATRTSTSPGPGTGSSTSITDGSSSNDDNASAFMRMPPSLGLAWLPVTNRRGGTRIPPGVTRRSRCLRGPCVVDRGDRVGEGVDLGLPAVLERSLEVGHVDLLLGNLHEALVLQDLDHDRTHVLEPADLFFGGHDAGLLVRLRGHLGREQRVPCAARKPHVLQEVPDAPDRAAHTSGRAEDVEVGGRDRLGLDLVDVVRLDHDVVDGHPAAELVGDARPVAVLRCVYV